MRELANFYLPILAILSAVGASAKAEKDEGSKPVSFIRDVAPIVIHRCQACHGAKKAESNYRLDSFKAMVQPGDFAAPPVTAGELDNSEIHRLITSDDADERMPNNGDRLTGAEIHTIDAWILQGAKFDGRDEAAPLREQIPRDIPQPPAPDVYPTPIPVTAMVFTSDGKRLVTGGYHELLIWDADAGTLLDRVGNIPQRTYGMAFSPDGSWLAVAGGSPGVSGEVRIIPWEDKLKASATPKALATQEDVFFDVAFRPDGQQLAAVGADGLLRAFDTGSGEEKIKIEAHADWANAVCYSPDGKYIATASRDKTAKVFDAATGKLIASHSEHNAPVRAVAFTPDGKAVISAGGNRIHVWNIEDAKMIGEMTGFEKEVDAIALNGETVLAASAEGSVRQFNLADRKLVRAFPERQGSALSLTAHAPSHRVAAGSLEGAVSVHNLADGALVKRFIAAPGSSASAN